MNLRIAISWLFFLRIFCILIIAVLSGLQAHAQKHDANWVFGVAGGISFGDTSNVYTYHSEAFNQEVNASISDSLGELLFYLGRKSTFFGGMNLYDKTHQIISNGDSIAVEQSATNGAIILPKPGSSTLFYLFHKELYSPPTVCADFSCIGLYQTVVSLNTSGELIVLEKNTPILLQPSGEKLAAVRHANGEDWWLLMQATPENSSSPCTNKFYVYSFSKDGIQLSSSQNIGSLKCDTWSFIGEMTFNREGTQLAAAISHENIVELFDFDRCTGVLSNYKTIDHQPGLLPYGCEFSPNGRFLYISSPVEALPSKLYQYDLASFNKTLVWTDSLGVYGGQLQLAPDNKIYLTTTAWAFSPFDHSLGVVNSPDSGGLSCNFRPFSFLLNDSSEVYVGLPNMPNYQLGATPIYQADAGTDTSWCMEDSLRGVYIGSPQIPNVLYSWQPEAGLSDPNSARPFANPSQTTMYVVTFTDTSIKYSCQSRQDTVWIRVEYCKDVFNYPSAFTPNDDHVNDEFEIINSKGRLVEFKIYNRWGQLVHNSLEPWNGTYKGTIQPQGTFVFYAILRTVSGDLQKISGAVSLIR